MMLLHKLPTSSISFSMSTVFFPTLPDSLPSNTSILLSLLATLVILSFVRAALLCFRPNTGKQVQQPTQTQAEAKAAEQSESTIQRRSSRAWGLLIWDNLRTISLPISLTMAEKETAGKGIGLQGKRPAAPSQPWQPVRSKRGGPAFETPLPALYQSGEPMSMAKMIMSRHTYRRPTSRPPARVPSIPPRSLMVTSPSTSHPPSMV